MWLSSSRGRGSPTGQEPGGLFSGCTVRVKETPIRLLPNSHGMQRLTASVIGACMATSLAACGGEPTVRDPGPGPVRETSTGLIRPDGTSLPPWPAPGNVASRVASAGLDLGPMGTAEHYHPHLQIIVNGREVPVPPNIGVDPVSGDMSALHTHEGDGTIHIEADRVGEAFTLGQLFTEWGVALTATQIGGVRARDGERVSLTSNGAPVSGDPAQLRLEPEQKIVLQLS